jgi:hypothetical protein
METGLHLAALGPDNIICGIIASQWLLTLFVHALPDGNASQPLVNGLLVLNKLN